MIWLSPHGINTVQKMSLAGRTALITGSTSGIGQSTAKLLAARGCSVLVTGSRSLDNATDALQDIRSTWVSSLCRALIALRYYVCKCACLVLKMFVCMYVYLTHVVCCLPIPLILYKLFLCFSAFLIQYK